MVLCFLNKIEKKTRALTSKTWWKFCTFKGFVRWNVKEAVDDDGLEKEESTFTAFWFFPL